MSPRRPPSAEQLARNEQIIEMRREGLASLNEISEMFGITRERVRQISREGGISNALAAQAFAKNREREKIDNAEQHAAAILMSWIGGKNVNDIAKDLNLTVRATQAILDEQVTDQIMAARSNFRLARKFPDAGPGPKDRTPRDDRYWTEDLVFETLVQVARDNGGRLPSSPEYKKMSAGNERLPSFPTVRNRLGRWSSIKVRVHAALKH